MDKKQEYYNEKAKYAYKLFCEHKPFVKVYGVVEKDGKYIVHYDKKKDKYMISGGGVEENEDLVTALKREIDEELNIKIDVVKQLDVIHLQKTWRLDGKEFDVDYEVHVFYSKYVAPSDRKEVGLYGEFDDNVCIKEISKQQLLEKVDEFCRFGVKF